MITTKTFELLEQMESMIGTGSRKQKSDILVKYKDVLQEIMDIAFNPYRIFNVIKIPEESLACEFPDSLEKLASFLEAQKGGTNENKNIVAEFLLYTENLYGPVARKWCKAAILKNIKIGIDIKTLNKAGYNLPEFKCLLADPNPTNSLEGITFPAYIQPKLDGCRVIMMPDGKFLGRNGRIVPNIQLKNHVNINGWWGKDQVVLDGEFFSFKRKFNEIIGYFSKEDEPLPDDIKYVVFNILTLEEWKAQHTNSVYKQQIQEMNFLEEGGKNIIPISTYIINSPEEAKKKYQEFLEQGFEGAMVRNMNSTYQWSRVKVKDGVLIKLKPSDFADCLITGWYEGKDRNAGRLGGFTLDYKNVEVKCGGGFSDYQRDEFWKIKEKLVGQWCRVKYTELTLDGSLRFPVWDNLIDER